MLVGVQEGRTAVHLAAMNGHHDTLKALLLTSLGRQVQRRLALLQQAQRWRRYSNLNARGHQR